MTDGNANKELFQKLKKQTSRVVGNTKLQKIRAVASKI